MKTAFDRAAAVRPDSRAGGLDSARCWGFDAASYTYRAARARASVESFCSGDFGFRHRFLTASEMDLRWFQSQSTQLLFVDLYAPLVTRGIVAGKIRIAGMLERQMKTQRVHRLKYTAS